jgi:hypothetical protein
MFLRRDTASEIFYHKRTFYDCRVPTGFWRRDKASEIFYTSEHFMIAVSLPGFGVGTRHPKYFIQANIL